MKKILLTGGSGFIGKNIIPLLRESYQVFTPTRQEVNLKNEMDVLSYVQHKKFDTIIHLANPNPFKNPRMDGGEFLFENSMRVFMNLYKAASFCRKILIFGSGAEYDKALEVKYINESSIMRSIPRDAYGFSKLIMNEIIKSSNNMYNLRIFGCYGPYDHESKFITHVIMCCLKQEDITINQNCYFDYLHVFDLAKVIAFFIENEPKYKDYNVASGRAISLLEIANEVKRQMQSASKIVLLKEGLNKEYTANIERLQKETNVTTNFITLEEGIAMQIAFEKERAGL